MVDMKILQDYHQVNNFFKKLILGIPSDHSSKFNNDNQLYSYTAIVFTNRTRVTIDVKNKKILSNIQVWNNFKHLQFN